MSADEPIVRYALSGSGRELVRVDARSARYLLLQAAHPAWQDRAGLFRVALSESVVEQVGSVAAAVIDGPVAPRGRHGPTMTASVGDTEVTTALTDPTAPESVLLSQIIDAARPHPVSVVAMAAELINEGDVRLAFMAVGTDSVDLQLRRETCRVSALVDGGWRTVWSGASSEAARLTLVAPPVGFVDGVRSPAVLDPGVVARTMLPGALDEVVDRARVIVDIDATMNIPDTRDLTTDESEAGLTVDVRGRWPIHLTAGVRSSASS